MEVRLKWNQYQMLESIIIFIDLTRTPSSGIWLACWHWNFCGASYHYTIEIWVDKNWNGQALNYLLFTWQIKISAIFSKLKKHSHSHAFGTKVQQNTAKCVTSNLKVILFSMYGKITHLKNKIIIFISYFVALFLEPENAF